MTSPPASPSGFSRTAITLVVGAIAISLVGAVLLSVFLGDLTGRPSASSDGYSVSAIGHHALVEVLEELDIPVVVSRHGSAGKVEDGLLIVAEPVVPPGDHASAAALRALVTSAPRTLLVLPKWYGTAETANRRWLETVSMLDDTDVDSILIALGTDARVARIAPGEVTTDELHLGAPSFEVARDMALAQVTTDGDGDALHAIDDHGLVTWFTVDETTVYLLTDPDVLNNAGLGRPGNARFAVGLIDHLRHGGPVVIDETLHGFAEEPSLWKALFRFPLAVVTLHVVLLAVLVLWAAVGRFGPARLAPPPLGAGKAYLIRNTAALMRVAGHHGHALERYLVVAVDAVRAELHAPPELTPVALAGWLERIRGARGGTITYAELTAEVAAAVHTRNPRQVLVAAERVHRWRLEMTHGPVHHP